MLTLEEALERLMARATPLDREQIAVADAVDRVLAETVQAPVALPLFDNSAMDGYAVRSADLAGATPAAPVLLKQIGVIPAGSSFEGEIQAGQCVRIFTGSPLPRGADAVLMQEDTARDTDGVLALEAVKPWENVRFQGEDVKQEAVIAEAGHRIHPARAGLLAACGVGTVLAHRQVRVGVAATGGELLEPGAAPRPGQIFESNRVMLAGLLRAISCQPVVHPIIPDDPAATVSALTNLFAECDVVVTTGGVSVGDFDHVKTAFTALGGELHFWKVSIKPGKPFAFGTFGGKLFFGLPGNPVSALVTFQLLARPALLRMSGLLQTGLRQVSGELAEAMSNPGDRRHFVRVRLDEKGRIWATGPQASHRLATLADADGLLDLPPGRSAEAGTRMSVLLFD